MASGHSNRAIGQAGEFAVCAQLGKLGLIATPFAGNVPEFDIIVSDPRLCTVPVQVKASFGHSSWQAGSALNWMDIEFNAQTGEQKIKGPIELAHPGLITVYVWLSPDIKGTDRYFLVTRSEIQDILIKSYEGWLAKHNYVRPKKPESYHIIISLDELATYENNWDLIRDRLDSGKAS